VARAVKQSGRSGLKPSEKRPKLSEAAEAASDPK
jgi:hypothetical protein